MTNNTTTKCRYGLCDGNGWVNRIEDGILYAKPCKCYEDLKEDTRLAFAKIPDEFKNLTIKSFDTSLYESEADRVKATKAKKLIAAYIRDFEDLKHEGKGLFLHSTTKGSGKTRLAISCGNALIKVHKQRVRYITTLDLLSRIKQSFNDDSAETEQQLVNEFTEIPVLILDDIGTEQSTPWVREIFYRVLDTRMTHKRITIITSNLSLKELKHDDRIKSRLGKMVITIQMPEEDIRCKLGEIENEAIINRLLGIE